MVVIRRFAAALLAPLLVGFAVASSATDKAAAPSYTFAQVVALGDAAPGGGQFEGDFELGAINNRGDVLFTSESPGLDPTSPEGVWMMHQGKLLPVVLPGTPAPGGGTFGGYGVMSMVSLNDAGDAAIVRGLVPGENPYPANSGVYRYTSSTGQLTAVVIPHVTPAPTGGAFIGGNFNTSLNNGGTLLFSAIIPTAYGTDTVDGLGVGLFEADRKGHITVVVAPGDLAPSGSTFDFARVASLNDRGDVAFGAHEAGDEVIGGGDPLFAGESTYVKWASTGQIVSIAHQGDPAPGGGTFRLAYIPHINNRGDIVFGGDLTLPTDTPDLGKSVGLFLYSNGQTSRIAGPGDPMPGGGHFVTAAFYAGNWSINNRGDVVFNAVLDTDDNNDGLKDEGLYLWSHGKLSLVARSGTVIPGIGMIAQLNWFAGYQPDGQDALSWAWNNDRGQILFGANLADGNTVLLVAIP